MKWFDAGVRWLERITLIILILVGGLVAFSFFPVHGEQKLFVVQSGSMEPALPVGSLIFVRSAEEYSVGDIVTRRTDQTKITITHRIIAKDARGGMITYRTKGDANRDEDGESVPNRTIIGKVVFDIPYAGYPVSFAKTPWGFGLMVILPAILIIIDEFNNLRKEFERRAREKREAAMIADMRIDV